MAISYNLAPNGRWSARENTGFAAVGGKVYTYQNQTRVPKATFEDSSGTTFNTNPIELDSAGEANIYWANDQFYTIEVYDKGGFLLYSQDNYPAIGAGGGGGDIIINETFKNIVLNNQFLRWGNDHFNQDPTATTSYTRLGTNDVTADDWSFKRNNTNATVVVSQKRFNVGQSQVPGNPINYLNYECDNVGSGSETFKAIYQSYPSAQLFSNTEISFSIWAMSTSSDPLNVYVEQYFGSGGSPSATVTTQILLTTLTPVWTKYTGQITVPDVSGKVFGSNGDDSLNLCIGLPLNSISNLSISGVQLNQGDELTALTTSTVWDDLFRNTNTSLSAFQTGDYILSIFNGNRPGWILCNDLTIGSSFSGSSHTGNNVLPLFLLLWTLSETFVPIFTSSGAASTRGSSAIADFNADKRLSLTRTLGRVLGATGGGVGLTFRNNGQFIGNENVTLNVGNLPPHLHNYNSNSASGTPGYDPSIFPQNVIPQTLTTTNGSEHGLNSNPFSIMQPTLFLNCYIKL